MDLTPQELAVCLHLLRGLSHAGIAAELGLKESTVKTYRNRALPAWTSIFAASFSPQCRAEEGRTPPVGRLRRGGQAARQARCRRWKLRLK